MRWYCEVRGDVEYAESRIDAAAWVESRLRRQGGGYEDEDEFDWEPVMAEVAGFDSVFCWIPGGHIVIEEEL
jgi:hypothetical protein